MADAPLNAERRCETARSFRYDSPVDILDEIEIRVLGALVEKEITTPEYYPLSLNALVNACNQKSNRDPEMSLDEEAMRRALRTLGEKLLARSAATDGRVAKYEHRLQEAFNFTRQETAVMTELMLRGPQTPGELRSRAARLQPFDDLGQVQSTLQRLISREPPLVRLLPRQPGLKESRYAQLLSGNLEASAGGCEHKPAKQADNARGDEGNGVENRLAHLEEELAELKRQFSTFRKQFE